jgi:hypothetical protein
MACITLTKENIRDEHICCAFSNKKCAENSQARNQDAGSVLSVTEHDIQPTPEW